MAIMTVDPFEGIGITPGGDWSGSHQGVDRKTPRIYDYTAPSDAVIESVGGPYQQIVARRADGTKWRLAECGQILVSPGQPVKLGDVIARNALYRGGIHRSPHQNAGGDSGRSRFSGIVTHTKAQAAAILAEGNATVARQRTVKAGINAVRRMGPGTEYNVAGEVLKAGTVGNFIAFAHGPASQGQPVGNDIWYQGISGHWFWSGSFTSTNPGVLIDKTAEFADIVVTLPPVVEIPHPDPVPEPEAPEGPVDPGPIVVIPTPEPEEPPIIVVPDPEPENPETGPTIPPVVVVPPVVPDPTKPDEKTGIWGRLAYLVLIILRSVFGSEK